MLKTNKKINRDFSALEAKFNNIPAFVITGGEIVFVSDDFLEVQTKFNLREDTKNYHGTGFGGAIYSSLDPIYPIQLYTILGADSHVIWDLSASIEYLKPVDKDVYARFIISKEEVKDIQAKIVKKGRTVVSLPVKYEDLEGNIYAKAIKTIYIADKDYYQNKNSK